MLSFYANQFLKHYLVNMIDSYSLFLALLTESRCGNFKY